MNANIATKKIQKIMTKPIVSLISVITTKYLEFIIQIISIKNKSANLAIRTSRLKI